jgi:choline dehydrogenase-like flavoprotein
MSLDTRYDLICYGSGIATYILAALVAKSGKSVLLLNPENESHPADSLMSPIYFGKTQAQLLENIFNKFGKSFEVSNRWSRRSCY